jgi:membrane-bound serine protease (ClpP class)
MNAKVRSVSGPSPYRADVEKAMMDSAFELKIGDKVIKPAGELLSLTAKEACTPYGDPPENLLGAGIAPDVDSMLTQLYGRDGFIEKDFHLTWSETAAKWLNAISPILLGAGILLLLIEFKTPGFGLSGGLGVCLLLLVLVSHYIAGLAGYEPLALFILGLVLMVLELLVFTHSIICGVLGLICFFASFIWAMTDVWPGENFGGVSMDSLAGPVINMGLALVLAAAGFAIALKFLPKTWFYKSLVNVSASPNDNRATATGAASATGAIRLPEPGTRGVAITDLRPLGEIEIAGGRYQARAMHGQITRGSAVEVLDGKDFALTVRAATD